MSMSINKDGRHKGNVEKICTGKLEGRKDRSRSELRGLNCVEKDLQDLGVRRWRKRTEDRAEWAIILKETLAKL